MAEATDTPQPQKKVTAEIVLAIAGGLAVVGFFLPWLTLPGADGRVSGLDIARSGGVWSGLFAIPALALITAVLGGLRLRLSRYAGSFCAIAIAAPAAYTLGTHWPWLYTVPLVLGATVVVLGKLARAPWLNLPLGAVLVAASVIGGLVVDDEPVFEIRTHAVPMPEVSDAESDVKSDTKPDADAKPGSGNQAKPEVKPDAPASPMVGLGSVGGLGLAAAIPLVALALLVPFCGLWLLWSGLRKKDRERPLVFTGWSIIALDAYVAGLVTFGPVLVTAGIGFWMTAVSGAVLVLVSRPLKTRSKTRKPKAQPKSKPKSKPKAEDEDEVAASDPEPSSKPAPKPKAKKPSESEATDDAAEAKRKKIEKLKKLAKLKKLKKIKELQKRQAAEAKAEAAAEKKAAKQEAETAKLGAKLADEPEPVFAADPTAPPAPENEGRDALMKRMGVKAPPPPSDSELEDMLAAFKKKVSDD